MSALSKIFKKRLRPRGLLALGALLYIIFAMISLLNTTWVYYVHHELNVDFSYNFTENKLNYKGPGLYIESMGTPQEGSNLILFWEGAENQIRVVDFDGGINLTEDTIWFDIMLLELNSTEFWQIYGISNIGVFNLEPSGSVNEPRIIWDNEYKDQELKYVKQVPDLNNDGIPEIFVSTGFLGTKLPTIREGQSYYDFFSANPTSFDVYYDIFYTRMTQETTEIIYQLAVVPKYQYYINTLLWGHNGTRIRSSSGTDFVSFGEDAVIQMELTNHNIDILNSEAWNLQDAVPEAIFLKSTIDRSLYVHSDVYFVLDAADSTSVLMNWSDSIDSYTLRDAKEKWTMNNTDFMKYGLEYELNLDYNPIQTEILIQKLPIGTRKFTYIDPITYQWSTNQSVNITFAENGFRKITSIGNGIAIEFYPNEYFSHACSMTLVVDINGNVMWMRKGSVFVGTQDFNSDGFFDIGDYRIEIKNNTSYRSEIGVNDFALITLLNPTNGEIITIFDLQIQLDSSPFRYFDIGTNQWRFSPIGLTFSPEDTNNDGYSEIFGYVLNNIVETQNDDNDEEDCDSDSLTLRGFRLSFDIGGTNAVIFDVSKDYRDFCFYPNFDIFDYPCFLNRGNIIASRIDIDKDGKKEFIAGKDQIFGRDIFLLLGGCQQLEYGNDLPAYFREQESCVDRGYDRDENCRECNTNVQLHQIEKYQDWRSIDQMIALKQDLKLPERVGAVIGNMDGLFYYEDIRLGYEQNQDEQAFSDFFMTFSNAISIGAIIALILCVIIILLSLETPKEEVSDRTENVKKLQKMVKIAALMLFITQLIVTIYIMNVVKVRVEFSASYVGPQASLIAFILIYPAIWLLFALLPFIYMKVAPYFAERTYIKLQHRMMRKWQKMNKKEYQIIVTQMDNRKDVSILTYINRALLPVLMSFTIGITIYQGLAEGGLLTSLIQTFDPSFIAKTHPENLGIIQPKVAFEHIWVEMGKFATFCVLPMIVTFFFTSMLIPSSWLLDDAGVAYYIRNLKQRSINDVESISSWLLKIVGGFFGMSAILSFISLFNPFFGQVNILAEAIETNIEGTPGGLGVAIFVLTLILFPLIMSFALMSACITKVEENIHPMAAQLFIRMEKMGLNVTPVEIAAILDANVGDKPWTEGRQDDVTGDERIKSPLKISGTNKEGVADEVKAAITQDINSGLMEIPEEIGKMDFEEALNIVKGKINQAFQFGLQEMMNNLDVLKTKILGLQEVYNELEQKLGVSLETISNKLKIPIDSLMAIVQPIMASIPELSLEMGVLKVQIQQAPIEAGELDKSVVKAMKQSQLIANLSNLFMSLYMLISA